MNAIILEIKGKNAIVLSKDGRFLKVKNKGQMKVGNEIELPEKNIYGSYGFVMKTIAAAAVFALTLGTGYGVYSYNTPYSYIDVDINPSLEIVTNIYDRILRVEAMNDDAATILKDTGFKNKRVDVAVEEIIKRASDSGYIKSDVSNAVMLTVSSKDEKKAEKVEKKVTEAAKVEVGESGINADIVTEKLTVERHDEARKLDISPGKMLLIEKLQVIEPEAKIEDYKNATVKEIMNVINSRKKESKEERKDDSKDIVKNNELSVECQISSAKSQSDIEKKDKNSEVIKPEKKDNNGNKNIDINGRQNTKDNQKSKDNQKNKQSSPEKDKKEKTVGNNPKGKVKSK